MKTIMLGTAILLMLSIAFADSGWQYSKKDDPLHGTSFDEFVLDGKFLTPPRSPKPEDKPSLVLHCDKGKVKDGYLVVGAVVDRSGRGQARIEMRLDGNLSTEFWNVSTDGQAVFLDGSIDLLKILYGHWLPHKEGKGDFIKQEIFGVQEAFGSTIVMQFDMPADQARLLDSCTTVKRGRRY
jgi:hypothetical protein